MRKSSLAFALLTVAAQGQAPDVRVSTRLVTINVVVSGRSASLTKDDFTLLDQGKPQRIAVFQASGKAAREKAPQLPAGVYSNRYQQRSYGASILLLDMTNTPVTRQPAVKQQVIKALEKLEEGTNVALYVLDGRLWVLHEFTSDFAHLKETLAGYKTGAIAGIDMEGGRGGVSANPGTAGTPLGQMAANADAVMAGQYTAQRMNLTFSALAAIARHVKPYHGRKSLVWVTGAFPQGLSVLTRIREGTDARFAGLGRLLNEADLAVYGVEDIGMTTLNRTQAQTDVAARATLAPRAGSQAPTPDDTGIRTLAELSGGGFTRLNNLDGAVRQALSDNEASYTLGFYPGQDSLDGKFHEVKVQVRAKGVKLRHRKGYFALEDRRTEASQLQEEMRAAMSSPFDATGIGMSVRVDASDQPKPGSVRLIVGIDLATLRLEEKNGHQVGLAEMKVIQTGSDGRELGSLSDNIRLDLTKEQHAKLLQDGVVVVKHIVPAEGATQGRVVVLDHVTGNLGSVAIAKLNPR